VVAVPDHMQFRTFVASGYFAYYLRKPDRLKPVLLKEGRGARSFGADPAR
jgi:hypothetical protein